MKLNLHNPAAWTALATAVLLGVSFIGCETATTPLTPPGAVSKTISETATEQPTANPSSEDPAPEPTTTTPAESPTTPETTAPAETAAKPAVEPAAKPADDGPPNPAATKPLADRTPRRPGEAEKITFDDLIIGMQADIVFRPWMLTDRPKELDGQRIMLSGFMHAGIEDPSKVKEFVLLRNLECKFGPGGQADHLAIVVMKPGSVTRYPGQTTVRVEGTLKMVPAEGLDGNTWSIYRIEDAVMK